MTPEINTADIRYRKDILMLSVVLLLLMMLVAHAFHSRQLIISKSTEVRAIQSSPELGN